jgi:transmembrane sensor
MATIIDFNDRVKIEEAAAQWITKIDRTLSAAEEGDFKVWITSSATHYKTFMKMAEQWDRSESLRKFSPDLSGGQLVTRKRPTYRGYAAAACFFLVIILSFVTYQQWPLSTNVDAYRITYSQEFSTDTQSASEFQLPDGTRLKLNVRSKVTVSYSSKMRRVQLHEGELFVDVAHDLSRPLVVIVKDRFIKAVGTAFNVEFLNKESLEVIVTEGKVVFGLVSSATEVTSASTATTPLSSGQQAILGGLKDIVSDKSAEEIKQALAWKQGALIFNEQTLKEVLNEMHRYNDYDFVLKNADMESIKVTGYFKANNLQQFLAAMENNFGIHHKIENGSQIVLFN